MKRQQKGTLYLLHFSKPFRHARHYLGFTAHNDAVQRVTAHQKGQGAKLTREAVGSGIKLYLAWYAEGTRHDERRLKRCAHVSQWCPLCRFAAGEDPPRVPARKAVAQ